MSGVRHPRGTRHGLRVPVRVLVGTVAVVVALTTALVVALVVGDGTASRPGDQPQVAARAAAGTEAEQAAREAVVAMTTYDAATAEEDFAWAEQIGTPAFRETFAPATADLVDLVTQLGSSATGTVLASAATVRDTEHVEVLLFVDQEITAPGSPPRLEEQRVRMQMVRSEGRWLVDEVEIDNLLTR